eukprot:10591307-Alexandrium_andersonii.AAC.1
MSVLLHSLTHALMYTLCACARGAPWPAWRCAHLCAHDLVRARLCTTKMRPLCARHALLYRSRPPARPPPMHR